MMTAFKKVSIKMTSFQNLNIFFKPNCWGFHPKKAKTMY